MKLLFVCTGNTCRSPMAEAIARKILSEKGLSVECSSAGIYAISGQAISMGAEKTLETLFGIRDFSHSATPLTKKAMQEADLVIAMTEDHKALIRQNFGMEEKLLAMPLSVGDPYGGDLALYEACALKIASGIEALYKEGIFLD